MHDTEHQPLSHHATLFRGLRSDAFPILEQVLGVAFTRAADPDISFRIYNEPFGISDVRELARRALHKPIVRTTYVHIIATDTITHESQHALLKLTEDPPPYAQFIFVVPASLPLLDTLRSRVDERIIKGEVVTATPLESIATTLRAITKITKEKDDAKMEAMLTTAELRLQNVLTLYKREHTVNRGALDAVILARRFIESRGASSKMLLEHLAIAEAENNKAYKYERKV
jgi:DNA polymerase III delta prime subunit